MKRLRFVVLKIAMTLMVPMAIAMAAPYVIDQVNRHLVTSASLIQESDPPPEYLLFAPLVSNQAPTLHQIVFTYRHEMYRINADGTGLSLLSSSMYGEACPQWSPSHTYITFGRDRGPSVDRYVMKADGSEQVLVLPYAYSPICDVSWSPTGTQFVSFAALNPYAIYTINRDGTGLTWLTNGQGNNTSPDWSPDGARIVFASDRDGDTEIYSMNTAGSEQQQLTDNTIDDYFPSWSPDGRYIAFLSGAWPERELYVMKADGSELVRLTNNTEDAWSVDWSPDSQRIAFTQGYVREIHVINRDGTGEVKLPIKEQAFLPNWSPDGSQIAFAGYVQVPGGYVAQLFVIDADGTDERQLTYPNEIYSGVSGFDW